MGAPETRRRAPKLVLFDLDDTLVSHLEAVEGAFARLTRSHPGLAARSPRQLAAEYQRRLLVDHPKIVRGRLDPDTARVDRLRAVFAGSKVELRPSEARDVVRLYQDAYRESRRAIPGAVGVLRALGRSSTIGVLSNNRRAEQLQKLDEFRLSSRVDLVVTSEEMPWSKPDPRAFRRAVALGGCGPDEATMVGDSLTDDAFGAYRAGLGAVWLNRDGTSVPADLPFPVLRSFRPVSDAVAVIRSSGAFRARGPSPS